MYVLMRKQGYPSQSVKAPVIFGPAYPLFYFLFSRTWRLFNWM